jgi:tetratricopeptide (TPR) repeat protein
MKKIILAVIITLTQSFCFAQSDKAKTLVNEGIELHDKGEYEKALKKYDEAIAESPEYADAFYEKSYTLSMLKRHEDCIEISKELIKKFPGDDILKGVYVQYGSALDDLGRSEEALKFIMPALKNSPVIFYCILIKGLLTA